MFVTGLHSHALQVPDVGAGAEFYGEFGLDVTVDGPRASLACSGRDQEQVLLREGPDKRLQSVTFTIAAGSSQELRRRLEAAGHPPVSALTGREEGLWVRDPDGLAVQFLEVAPAPSRDYPSVERNFDGKIVRVDEPRWKALVTPRPRRLGHVIKFTADLAAARHFYVDLLGLKLSDGIRGALEFWNPGTGGDHHVFGAIQSTHPGLHHASFEVADFDEIGMGALHLAERGHTLQWGRGRHSFGSNLFNYIQDPWGSWVEYFADMDEITCHWEGRLWDDVPAAMWPLSQPAEFLVNAESLPTTVPERP